MTLVLGIYQEKCSCEVVVPLVLRLRLRVARRTLLAALHTAQTARLSALVQVVDVERVAPTLPNNRSQTSSPKRQQHARSVSTCARRRSSLHRTSRSSRDPSPSLSSSLDSSSVHVAVAVAVAVDISSGLLARANAELRRKRRRRSPVSARPSNSVHVAHVPRNSCTTCANSSATSSSAICSNSTSSWS